MEQRIEPRGEDRAEHQPNPKRFAARGHISMNEVMTATQFQKHRSSEPRKYRNKVIQAHGRTFDSKKESARYTKLLILERKGIISDLQCQPRFNIVVNGMRIGAYRGDFGYTHEGKYVVEDVKSPITRSLSLYKWKKKLMKATHGIEIREV